MAKNVQKLKEKLDKHRYRNRTCILDKYTHTHTHTHTHLLFPEALFPEVCRVPLGDAELVPGKGTLRESGFELRQHVREHQGEFGQVTAVV